MSKDVRVGERWVVSGELLGEFEMTIVEKCGTVYYGQGASQGFNRFRTVQTWQVEPVFDGSIGKGSDLHFIRLIADAPATVDIGPEWGKSIIEKAVERVLAGPTAREAKAAEAKYEAPVIERKPHCGQCFTADAVALRAGRSGQFHSCDPCYLKSERSKAEATARHVYVPPSPPAMGPLPVRFEVGGWNKRSVR